MVYRITMNNCFASDYKHKATCMDPTSNWGDCILSYTCMALVGPCMGSNA